MNTFLYLIIVIIGTFFGSFFTLAVYRIPRKEDILIKHSYCPNCNHKLGFFDLFPVLSYVVLGGKCRYCKNKIRPRYLILELLSGMTFFIGAISLNIKEITCVNTINLAYFLIYTSILFIISGIDKENNKVNIGVVNVGYILEIIYMIYQYTLGNGDVYQYVMYFILISAGIILNNIKYFKDIVNKYYIQIFYLLLYILIYSGIKILILTVILSGIFYTLRCIIKGKREVSAIGFYLSLINLAVIITFNILINYTI